MGNGEIIRVIGCQGSIQLITATNAILHHQENRGVSHKNYLLVYELYAPHGQEVEFFRFIKKLARSGPIPFSDIVYLSPGDLLSIQTVFYTRGLEAAREKMQAVTGIGHVDEVFLTSNWHPGNKAVMHFLPAVSRICYGDSIGLYIPEGYFAEKTTMGRLKKIKLFKLFADFLEGLKIFLKHPARKPALRILKPQNFTLGYYLTLALTEEKPQWPVIFIKKKNLLETFNYFLKCFSFDLGRDPILNDPKLLFFLTTNFSEAGKMSMENEIRGYREYLDHYAEKGTTIIIKPHPRDSQKKLETLKHELIKNYKVKVLDNVHDFFVPFELSLIMLHANDPQKMHQISFHTFSSACLSIEILFGLNVQIGMGSELVNKYFVPTHRVSRIKHEADLKRVLAGTYE